MNCKLKLLMALAASGNGPIARAVGQEVQRAVNVQTAKPEIDSSLSKSLSFLATIVNEMRYTDFLLLTLLVIVIALFLIGMMIALKRALSRRTRLYLEIRQGTQAIHVRILTLNDGMRFYNIKAPTAPIVIDITHYVVVALLTTTTNKWRIKNTLTNDRMSIPKEIWLSPFVAFKLQRIINAGSYTVQPLLIHNQEFN